MGTIASHITSLTIVYSIVYSDADQRKLQSSASLAFVRGIHRGPMNSPHKWPVTRKKFPFDDVIMFILLGVWDTWLDLKFNPYTKKRFYSEKTLFVNRINVRESGVYTKFSGRLFEEPFPWLIQKFPCILIFKTGQPGCQLNLSEGQIRLDLTSGRPLV